jgi:hypothetical protein
MSVDMDMDMDMEMEMEMEMEMDKDMDMIFLFWFERKKTKLDLFRFCSVFFTKLKKILVCFGVSECFETNLNKQLAFRNKQT